MAVPSGRRADARRCRAIVAAGLLLAPGTAWAGPPYFSDDPEPTDLGHWEIYNFVNGTRRDGRLEGEFGFDLNYGGAKDLQLTAVLPLGYRGAVPGSIGAGDVELAAKYKFVHQTKHGLIPDVAFFPRVFLPTARDSRRVQLFLPVWAQKDLGKWAVFGGGGRTINPGPGQRDFWQTGLGATRVVTDRLTLGAELYHQGPDATDARAFTGVNVGATYRLKKPFSILVSVGPGVQNPRTQGRYAFYTALKLDL